MSSDSDKKRMLGLGAIGLVAVAGIVWALTSMGDSKTVNAIDRRIADESIVLDDFKPPDEVASRSAPQARSGSSRLDGASATEADRDDKVVDAVEKKTKRNKKAKRRRAKKELDDEEEAARSAKKTVRQPYGK